MLMMWPCSQRRRRAFRVCWTPCNYAAYGLTISIAKTKVVVFGRGYLGCTWKVAGQDLKRSQSFPYLRMLLHEHQQIKPI